MTEFEERITRLMKEAEKELRAIGIRPSTRILEISENRRAKKRLGCCKLVKKGFRQTFRIEISTVLAQVDDKALKQTILHELLHTCPGCFNHGEKWKKLAEQVNQAYGYRIKRLSSEEELGIAGPAAAPGSRAGNSAERARPNYKYRIRCTGCGTASYRMKRSRVVEHPEQYRCAKCGGALKVDQI